MSTKHHRVHFVLATWCWAWNLPLTVVCIPGETALETTSFFFFSNTYQLPWVSWLGMGDHVLFPLLALGLLAWTCTCSVHTAIVSVSSDAHQFCSVCRTVLPCFLSTLALTVFPPPSLHSVLSTDGRGGTKTSHLGLGLCTSSSCESLC